MDAKIDHFSELFNFLGDKSSVCADFLSLLGRFRLGHSLSRLKMEKEKGAKSILLLQYLLIFRLCGQSIHLSLHQQFGRLIKGEQHLELGRCQSLDLDAQIADSTLAFIAYSVISLRKRFSDYETFGDLFRDIRDGLLELTFVERLLPVIAELLERRARLFDSTLDELLERAIADPETRMDLESILRYNQLFKERA